MINNAAVRHAIAMAPRDTTWNIDDLVENGGAANLVDDATGDTIAIVQYQLVAGSPAFWQAFGSSLGIDRIGEFPGDVFGPGYVMLCVDIRIIEELAARRGESICSYPNDLLGDHDHDECQSALLDIEVQAKRPYVSTYDADRDMYIDPATGREDEGCRVRRTVEESSPGAFWGRQ